MLSYSMGLLYSNGLIVSTRLDILDLLRIALINEYRI